MRNRLDNKKVDNLCRVYNEVKSLRKVRKLTGHSINTIKKYIKGKVAFPIYPKPLREGYDKITVEKVRLYAHTVFDGHITHTKYNSYIVGYTNMNEELLREFEKDVDFVYGLKSGRHTRRGITNLYCCSKLMYYDIKNFDRSLIRKKEEYKIAYLRAFFDDEGCVIFNPKRGKFYINGCQHNQDEILFIETLLKDLCIRSKVYHFKIDITLNKDLFRYNELIGFTNSNKKAKLLKGLKHYKDIATKIRVQNKQIKEFYDKGLSSYQISSIIGMPPLQ